MLIPSCMSAGLSQLVQVVEAVINRHFSISSAPKCYGYGNQLIHGRSTKSKSGRQVRSGSDPGFQSLDNCDCVCATKEFPLERFRFCSGLLTSEALNE